MREGRRTDVWLGPLGVKYHDATPRMIWRRGVRVSCGHPGQISRREAHHEESDDGDEVSRHGGVWRLGGRARAGDASGEAASESLERQVRTRRASSQRPLSSRIYIPVAC
jgi:hypothetical protein